MEFSILARIIMLGLITLLFGFPPTPCWSAQTQVNTRQKMSQPTHQKDKAQAGYPNWKTATLGGKQFWTDVRYADGWRVQMHSETGHFRLLNAKSERQGWGNRQHCDQLLNQAIAEGKASTCEGKVVFALHGLMRTSSAMKTLVKHLHQKDGYTVINFQYASTRKTVGDHAVALKSVVDNLGPNVTEINFVGHSLGNIVVRRYLGDTTNKTTGRQGDARVKRVVMLAPPNQGSRMARILKSSILFRTLAGVSGAQLALGWKNLEPTLATPNLEFGIIAGGQETGNNFSNFILTGPDDFTVSLEETKLVGARDFLVGPLFHTTIMNQPAVLDATSMFLKHGYFESEANRKPITADQIKAQKTDSKAALPRSRN